MFKKVVEATHENLKDNEWQKKTININQAQKIANILAVERGEPEYHIDLFKELYAKLDLDDDGEVTLDEMLTFERDRQR